MLTRRAVIRIATAGAAWGKGKPPSILLRSSWQVVNIGDIAHTPGVIALLEKRFPGADIRLWPSSVANGVEAMLLRRFPKLTIVDSEAKIAAAFRECGFLLHGSGPSLVGSEQVQRWRDETKKPYGVFGITLPEANTNPRVIELLTGARFVFFRDPVSLEFAKERGVASPVMKFGPDGAFAVDLRNDAAANEFLAAHGLRRGEFLCCIPRFRNTPVWNMLTRKQPFNAERDQRNQQMKEHDHAQLRLAIARVVRETRLKVLICPEDETQVAIGKEMLFDPLPEDVKARVVWRDWFWLTDEAVSTYLQSAGLFGNEMHSPIMCVGHGIPAIVCRWAEQTSKGSMWREIGLGDWLFDMDDEAQVEMVVPAVMTMAKDLAGARRKAAAARKVVEGRQREMLDVLARELRV